MDFKIGDYVLEKDSLDIYIIVDILDDIVIIKGVTTRIKKEVLSIDLIHATDSDIQKELNKQTRCIEKLKVQTSKRTTNKLIYGTILHIDGDPDYLESCMSLYKDLGIFANGICIKEEEIKYRIEELVLNLTPDIVVITGHDVYNGKDIKNLDNYQNTKHFIDALRNIRKHFKEDSMIVIIGACGSHFEALIASGANFSSSPKRINIHTYDPAILAIKAATTSINQTIDFEQALKFIENTHDAYGGIETKGKMKILL